MEGLIFGILRYDGTNLFSLSLIYLYVYFFADTSDLSIEATQYFCVTSTSQQSRHSENHYLSPGGEGAGTLYNGSHRETPPARATFFRLQVYDRVGISLVEVYERVAKSVISVCKKAQKD